MKRINRSDDHTVILCEDYCERSGVMNNVKGNMLVLKPESFQNYVES